MEIYITFKDQKPQYCYAITSTHIYLKIQYYYKTNQRRYFEETEKQTLMWTGNLKGLKIINIP